MSFSPRSRADTRGGHDDPPEFPRATARRAGSGGLHGGQEAAPTSHDPASEIPTMSAFHLGVGRRALIARRIPDRRTRSDNLIR